LVVLAIDQRCSASIAQSIINRGSRGWTEDVGENQVVRGRFPFSSVARRSAQRLNELFCFLVKRGSTFLYGIKYVYHILFFRMFLVHNEDSLVTKRKKNQSREVKSSNIHREWRGVSCGVKFIELCHHYSLSRTSHATTI
jgi:hypothetical protein